MGYVTLNGVRNDDYQMDLLSKIIEVPAVKTRSVEIPLRDGAIDLTESFDGVIRYENRKITMTFEIRKVRTEWPLLVSELLKKYHGKIVKVIFGDDPDYYWRGRCNVGNLDDHGSTAGITFEIDAEPFKYTVIPIYSNLLSLGSTAVTIDYENEHTRGYLQIEAVNNTYASVRIEINGCTYKVTTRNLSSAFLPILTNSTQISITGAGKINLSIVGGDL